MSKKNSPYFYFFLPHFSLSFSSFFLSVSSFSFSTPTILPSLSVIILPRSVAISLQCSLGLVWLLTENWPLCPSAICLACYPVWISILLIMVMLLSCDLIILSCALTIFVKVSSTLLILSSMNGSSALGELF